MKLSDKIKAAARKSKAKFIGATVLFIIIVVWGVAPFSLSIYQGFRGTPPEELEYINNKLGNSDARVLVDNEVTNNDVDEDVDVEDNDDETFDEEIEDIDEESTEVEENVEETPEEDDASVEERQSLTDIMKQMQGQKDNFEASEEVEIDKFQWDIFFTRLGFYIVHPFHAFKVVFETEAASMFWQCFKIFFLIYLAYTLVGFLKALPKHEYDEIENGSSDWSKNGEQYSVLSKHKGIILAEKNYLPVDKRGNVNVLIVGGSGAGKSASYVVPNALQLLGSYIFTDPKGELYDLTSGYFREKGYDVKVLNLVRPENSDGYNPLFHIKNEIDVDVIAHTIVKGQDDGAGKSQDPFWDDMAEMLMKALIYYMLDARPREERSLASCSELIRCANSGGGSSLLSELINELPMGHPARMNYKNIEMLPEKTFGSVLGTLQSKLGKFDSQQIAEVTSTDTIDFNSIGEKKTALYVISSDTHTAYDFLLTIFFSQLIQQLYDLADLKGGKLPVPTFFILDEFANIGQIPDFDKKISTSRSRAISFSVILQNLDQLETVYKDSHETIVGNCDTHVFLGSNSQKTVEYFSKALGEKTIARDNVSINRDNLDWKSGKSESDQIMGRSLMTPDELRRLDVDKCIIFEKGIKPIQANKYYYFKYPEGKLVKKFPADHNDVHVERGVWRKFNPNNLNGDNSNGGAAPSLESLNDLFDDKPKDAVSANMGSTPTSMSAMFPNNAPMANNPFGGLDNSNPSMPNSGPANTPQQSAEEDNEMMDLQKELEAKFDELFGPLEDEANDTNNDNDN